jgi:hypothetical protein
MPAFCRFCGLVRVVSLLLAAILPGPAVGLMSSAAQAADLEYRLRVFDAPGATITDPTHVYVPYGYYGTVRMQLYASILGTDSNPTNDGFNGGAINFQSALSGVPTNPSKLHCDFTASLVNTGGPYDTGFRGEGYRTIMLCKT